MIRRRFNSDLSKVGVQSKHMTLAQLHTHRGASADLSCGALWFSKVVCHGTMFTKTGLRPREIQGRGTNRTNAAFTGGDHDGASTSLGPPLPGSWKKLSPIMASGRNGDSYGSGLAAKRRAEHPAARARFEPAAGVVGRRGTARPGRSAPSSARGRGGVPAGSTARKKARRWRRGSGSGGSNGSCPEKATSGPPSSVVVAADVTRGRSAKQQQQEEGQESRNSRLGSAVSADEKRYHSRQQLRHCHSASNVSTIYGGGGGGRKLGEAAVEPSVPATPDADLTAAGIEEGGELAEGVGIDDVTITVYAGGGSGGGGDDSGDDESTRAAAAAANQARATPSSSDDNNAGDGGGGGGSEPDDDGGLVESTRGLGGGGGKGGGCRRRVGGAETGLASIKAGLRAFSERVGRLETFGRADPEQRSTAGEGQQAGGRAGENDDQPEDVSTGLAGGAEAAATASERTCRSAGRRHEVAAHDNDHVSADTGIDMGKERDPLSHANPREYHRARPPPSSSLPFHKQGGRHGLDLAERIHLLEAQVFPAMSPPPPPPQVVETAPVETGAVLSDPTKRAFSHSDGVKSAAVVQQGEQSRAAAVRGGDARRGTEPLAREERMRAIIGDLASLSAALLERLITAEGRLRNAAAAGGGGSTDVLCQKARLMVAQAEAFLVLASAGDDAATAPPPAPPPPPTTTQEQQEGGKAVAASAGAASAGSTAAALALPDGGAALLPPPPLPRKDAVPPCPAAKDCWGEALDDLGRLVDEPPLLCFRGDGHDGVDAAKPPGAAGAPARPSSPQPPPSAVAAMPLSDRTNGGENPLAIRRPRRPLPPPLGAATTSVPRAGTPRWETRTTAAAAAEAILDDDYSGGAAAGVAVLSRRPVASAAVGHEEEEEEDVRAALPVASAPTPSKKPRHPFGRQGSGGGGSSSSSSPPMRSPRWLRDHVGNAHAEAAPGSGPWNGFPPLSASSSSDRRGVGANAREHGVGGGGGRDEAENWPPPPPPPPPIGQWYTPPLNPA
ncbi:unnamed protein product [Ectocarpus sp. CCAP 1310/34]|nr:unnamed protein product [Ectocarpus sp. CCAP 1310/34]